jgi:hypothetical protein
VVGRAPYHALGTSGVVFAMRVQLQKRAKKRQMKRHPSRRCALPNTGFLDEVKPLCGQGPPKDHMLWGERHSTLKRGACYACVKMGFYGKRGVYRCFSKNRNTFSGPGYAKCPNLVCVIFMTRASFFESVLVPNSSLIATTDP